MLKYMLVLGWWFWYFPYPALIDQNLYILSLLQNSKEAFFTEKNICFLSKNGKSIKMLNVEYFLTIGASWSWWRISVVGTFHSPKWLYNHSPSVCKTPLPLKIKPICHYLLISQIPISHHDNQPPFEFVQD